MTLPLADAVRRRCRYTRLLTPNRPARCRTDSRSPRRESPAPTVRSTRTAWSLRCSQNRVAPLVRCSSSRSCWVGLSYARRVGRCARALLPGVRLDEADMLGGSDRSVVRRVRAHYPGGDEPSLIVKSFATPGEWWAREAAALSIVSSDAPTAHVVAESADPPVVVMTDIGTGPSVADALLGADPEAGAAAVLMWAEALAALHGSTLGSRETCPRCHSGQRSGETLLGESRMSLTKSTRPSSSSRTSCSRLDVRVPSHAFGELREIPRTAHRRRPRRAVAGRYLSRQQRTRRRQTPAPRLRRCGAVAARGVGRRVPDRPVALVLVLVADAARRTPNSRWSEYRATIEARPGRTCVLPTSAMTSLAPRSPGCSSRRRGCYRRRSQTTLPPADPSKLTPSRRAMILHRLNRARDSDDLPAIAELADTLRATLVERWGEVPLAYAPAFEDRD